MKNIDGLAAWTWSTGPVGPVPGRPTWGANG